MRHLALHTAALSLICACGTTPPPDEGTPTPTEATPTPAAERSEHCGDITTAEIWTAAANPHRITCDVTVTGGSVTLEQGVEIVVEGAHYLWVDDGDLIADGAEEAPIRFDNAAGGTWYGIHIAPGAGDVSLKNTIISGAIQRPGTTDFGFGPLVVDDAQVLVENLAIRGQAKCGLVLKAGGALKPGSGGLSISDSEQWPVCTTALGAGSLPAAGADLTGNGDDFVYVTFDDSDLSTSATWQNLGVPYVVAHPMNLQGTAADPAVLTLNAGVQVRFSDSAYIRIARYDDHASGGLISLGTEAEPVILTGHDGVARGAWGGITAYTATPFELHHTVFENGGFANGAALYLEGGHLLVDHVAVSGSAGHGFSLISDARFDAASTHLSVTDCKTLGRVYGDAAGSIPETGVDLSGNDTTFVSVEGKGGPVALAFSDTWGDIGVDYRINAGFDLEGTASAPTILTLEPGVSVTFANSKYLGIGGKGAAGLMAVGTAEAPITFTAADSLSAGAWAGLYFSRDTVAASTLLEHVEVGYAGANAFYRRQGAIIIDEAEVTLRDTWIHHSECNGIAVYGAGQATTENVTYSQMGSGEGCLNYYDETPDNQSQG